MKKYLRFSFIETLNSGAYPDRLGMGIDIHPVPTSKTDQSHPVEFSIIQRHAGWSSPGDQDRDLAANNLGHDLTGDPAAGEQYLV